jgi:NAD(P)-dependent dehydrogenase (short-subunit alcohol dehydrogenase family)
MKKVILITGASSGIGKSTALLFANQGWQVIATMRDPAQATDLNHNENILVTKLDVSDTSSIVNAIELGISHFGQIDALVNNAGYGQQGIFEAISEEKIRKQFDVNVFGLMEVTRAILPHFRSKQQGTIVNVTSGAGQVTVPLISVYAASKFAVEGFSESLSYELESQNIRVKIIEPGYIATPFYQRAASEFAHDPSLTDYNGFQEQMKSLFSSFASNETASSDEVASKIYHAVTDGSHNLRYVVGLDLKPLIEMRNSSFAQDYIETMRKQFMPDSFK